MFLGGDLLKIDGQARGVPRAGREQRGERGDGGVGRYARAQGAQAAVAGAAGQRPQPLLAGQEFMRLVQQNHAGRGEPDLTVRPVEQCGSEVLLQPAHRLAEGWLGHAEPVGGPAEVQLVGDGDEDTQVAQEIHNQ